MLNPHYFLQKYGITITEQDTTEEKLQKLATAFGLYEIYEGNKPYIFISYAHKDAHLVMPTIKAIQEKGYPVWYDAGIRVGDEWAANIARHLKNCKLVIAFASKNYFASPNCRAEVTYAFSNQKQMLTVRLDSTPLPEGLDMHLSLSQMFEGYTYDDGDEFVRRLANLPFLKSHVNPSQVSEIQEQKRKAKKAALAKQEEERRKQEEARRQQEEARRKAETEAAAQKRREEAEVQRLLDLENQVKQKRLQEEIQARIRQEEELAKKERQRRENERKKRQLEEETQQRREESKKRIDAAAKQIKGLLKDGISHEKAIELYNTEIYEIAKGDEQLEAYAVPYYEQLCETVYQDAERYETSRNRHWKAYAGRLFFALPSDYRDASRRYFRLCGNSVVRKQRYGWFVCLAFLALNVFLSHWVLHLVNPWFFKLLLMQVPAAVVLLLARFGARFLRVDGEAYLTATLFLHAVTLIANACLFQGIGFWLRLLWTVIFTIISAIVIFFGICGDSCKYSATFATRIKKPGQES